MSTMTAAGPDGPYFERENTLDLIESLASQQSLVIYAGAGVSIDRTNITWPQLIERLMVKHIPDGEVRQRLVSDSPLQSASILKQMYITMYGTSDKVDQHIGNDVHSVLYSDPERELRRAGIARAIVRLVVELKRLGKPFYLVTTNYDDYIQQELTRLKAKRGTTSLVLRTCWPKLSAVRPDVVKSALAVLGKDRIVHLHGCIPEFDNERTPVTLSEVDYATRYPLSSAVLGRLFEDHPVLILGSSLTDPPLINALADSKNSAAKKGLPRVAVVPIQGFSLPGGVSDEVRNAIRENVRDRMEHFDVEVTFPDLYSQVAQFVTEVQVANCHGAQPYRELPVRYGRRLDEWWATWSASRSADWAGANQRDHLLLRECVQNLSDKQKLHDPSVEIEIWLRWKPGHDSRQLRLWASSKAAWPEIDARTAAIIANSRYISVKTFTNGRIDHHPLNESAGHRRRRYLSVPIKLGESDGLDLPVGVISLAYGLGNGPLPMGKLMRITDEISLLGNRIASS
jgi:hypothetical protein